MTGFTEWLEERRTEGLGPVLSLVLIACGIAGFVGLAWHMRTGASSPAFKGRDLAQVRLLDAGGNTRRLGDLKGKVVVLDFWATWCPPCRMSLPEVAALQARQGETYAVVPVSLDRGGFGDVLPFFAQNPQLAVFAAVPADPGKLQDQIGPIRAIPTTLILDRTGKVLTSWSGYSPGRLEQELQAALRGN